MSDTTTKILPKKLKTNREGIFYKEIQQSTIGEDGKTTIKIIDKIYIIRYRAKGKERLVTLGKKSEGIGVNYCKTKRDEYMVLERNGELPPQIEKRLKRTADTIDDLAKLYFDDKRCMKCTHCKAFHSLKDEEKESIKLQETKNKRLIDLYNDGLAKDQKIKGFNCNKRNVRHLLNKYNKHLVPKFGKANPSMLESKDIKKLKQKLQGEDKANNTINGIIQLMSAIINHSINDYNLNVHNPCKHIGKLSTEDNDRERWLSTDEINNLYEALKDDERALLFAKLALTTGGRLKGILNITKGDLDFDNNTIKLKDFKTNTTYLSPLTIELKTILTKHTKLLEDTDYIIGGKDTHLSTNALSITIRPTLNRLFNKGLDKSDSKKRVVIHTLRHTFASHLAINGVPIYTIQKLMNHKDMTMTARYAKLRDDQGFDAVKGLYNG